MAFKIIENPTFWHNVPVIVPVDMDEQGGGGYVEQSLKVKFRVVPNDDLMDHNLRTSEGSESYCRAVAEDFGDIIGEGNIPMQVTDGVRNQLFRTSYIQIALIRHYSLALTKARLGN